MRYLRNHVATIVALTLGALSGAAPAVAEDIVSNLRGHWLLTETSGTTADDASTLDQNGTYTGGVTLAGSTPVRLHNELAAQFDGVNDYVAIPGEANYDITGAITVAGWIKVDVWDVAWQAIVTKGDGAWRLMRDNINGGVTFACSGTSGFRVSTPYAVNDGQWHHIVGVYTGSQLRIYVDGSLAGAVASTGAISTNNYPVQIARNAQLAGVEFDGAIYDVRVYARALSAADIFYLATQGKPIAHYKLDESAGTTAVDSSLAMNGAVTGTVAWTDAILNNGHQFNYANGDDFITLPSNTYLDSLQESSFTISSWFKPLSTPPGIGSANDAAYGIVLKSGWHTGLAYTNANRFILEHFLTGDVSQVATTPSTTYAPGEFHHVVGVVDRAAGTTKLYVNGVLTQTTSFTPGAASREYFSTPWRIGISAPTNGTYKWPCHGVVDDVRMYYRTVTPSEVAELHGLIGHWKFAEGVGTTASDSTLSANNATLSGGATWSTDCAGNKALVTTAAGGVAQTSTPVTPPAEGTIAFWMQPTAGAALRRICGLGGDWEIRQQADGTVVFDLCADGGTNSVSTTIPLNEAGRWYHVAITYNSTDDSFAIYVDGALHRSGTNPNNMVQQAAGVLSFGARTGVASEYWGGSLRDFRLYNRRIPSTEIAELAGLAAYWKLDEAAGAVASDSSPWGRQGTVAGTPTWAAGKVGNAIQLDGTNYVAASAAGLNSRNLTIAAWANLTAADSGGAELISIGDCFSIRLNEGGNTRAFFHNGTTWQGVTVNQTFAGAGWRHFAAVFDDDNNILRFYINGSQVGTLATTGSISYNLGPSIVIGRHGNGNAAFDFSGKIDDVRIYSRALCAAQITELVNDGGGTLQGVRIINWVETR